MFGTASSITRLLAHDEDPTEELGALFGRRRSKKVMVLIAFASFLIVVASVVAIVAAAKGRTKHEASGLMARLRDAEINFDGVSHPGGRRPGAPGGVPLLDFGNPDYNKTGPVTEDYAELNKI